MKVPYYEQEFWYSCFATCVKMILEYYGVKKSERDLRILLKTAPRFGTLWKIAEKEIKKLGFELKYKMHMPVDELTNLVKSEIPVIASIDAEYEEKNIGHVGIVVDIGNNTIVFNDPEKGIITFDKTNFLELWNKRKNIAGYIEKIYEK